MVVSDVGKYAGASLEAHALSFPRVERGVIEVSSGNAGNDG
jgi:hypothetical protein